MVVVVPFDTRESKISSDQQDAKQQHIPNPGEYWEDSWGFSLPGLY